MGSSWNDPPQSGADGSWGQQAGQAGSSPWAQQGGLQGAQQSPWEQPHAAAQGAWEAPRGAGGEDPSPAGSTKGGKLVKVGMALVAAAVAIAVLVAVGVGPRVPKGPRTVETPAGAVLELDEQAAAAVDSRDMEAELEKAMDKRVNGQGAYAVTLDGKDAHDNPVLTAAGEETTWKVTVYVDGVTAYQVSEGGGK